MQPVEYVSRQACPEIGLDVVPCIEVDLQDVTNECGVRCTPVARQSRLPRQVCNLAAHGPHEEGLPRTPVTEYSNRARRFEILVRDVPRQVLHRLADADTVLLPPRT